MLIVFLLQDNAILLHLESLKKTCFSLIELCFETGRIYFFFFSIQNIRSSYSIIIIQNIRSSYSIISIQNIRSSCSTMFLKIFPIISNGKFLPSQLCLFIKGLIFVFLSECFPIPSWFNAIVTAYWKHLSFFIDGIYCCFFCFLSNQENLYMMHHNSDLFYIYDIINEHNWRQTHYLSLILPSYFEILFYVIQKVLL